MGKLKKKSKRQANELKSILNQDFIAEAQLDFHHFLSLDPIDIEIYLDEFLEESQINKYKGVLVITGKGRVVKPIVQKLLKHSKRVESFKQAGYFNGQDGAFEVTLKA